MSRTTRFRAAISASLAAEAGLTPLRGNLLAKLQDNLRLAEALAASIPAALLTQVRFATLRQSRLVFLADNAAAASRLRLMQVEMLAAARRVGVSDVAGLVVKVVPREMPDAIEPRVAKPISSEARRQLSAASMAAADPEISALLDRLAKAGDP